LFLVQLTASLHSISSQLFSAGSAWKMQVIQYKWFSFQCVLALLFIVVFDIKFEA
jgi:hypothetical protein